MALIRGSGPYVDPICGMKVDRDDSSLFIDFEGKRFHFCSEFCLAKFKKRGEKKPLSPDTSEAGAIYTCPMHPQVKNIGPGSCPICGMGLDPLASDAARGPHPELKDFSRRFIGALFFTLPLLVISMDEKTLGAQARLLQWALATPVLFWAGYPLFQRGIQSIFRLNLNMFTLVAIGSGVSYCFSAIVTVFPNVVPAMTRAQGMGGGVYFEPAAVIVTLVLLGQILELRARGMTASAVQALLKLSPRTARRISKSGDELEVPIGSVAVSDRLRVRPGEQVPVDGVVIRGQSAVDESMISGESIPIEKNEGAEVSAGTLNGNGSFVVEATRVGGDTLLAQIVHMASEAQRTRAPIQQVADTVAVYFVPAVIAVSVGTLFFWLFHGPEPRFAWAVLNSVAVLIIACPCALGLATPMAITVGAGEGARSGILIRNAEAIETLERVDTLVLDKTGTLTEGRPKLVSVRVGVGFSEKGVLGLAASLERQSEHSLASAILTGAMDRGALDHQDFPEVSEFRAIPGKGVSGRSGTKKIALGNLGWFAEMDVKGLDPLEREAGFLRSQGQTVFFMAIDGKGAAVLGVVDPIKKTAREAVRLLKKENISILMVTGDHLETAKAVAKQLGIADVRAGIPPDQKIAIIRELKSQGKVVAMAGDGINDAPALAAAHVGIAMGTGADFAMQSAGITLVKGDLRAIVKARHLSQAMMRNIRQNLFFAIFYNGLGIPLAAAGWLSPMIASVAMSLSSVSVIGNALRLRRFGRTRGST